MSIIEQTDNIHLKWGIFVENKYYTAPSSKEAYLISNHTGSGEILGPWGYHLSCTNTGQKKGRNVS